MSSRAQSRDFMKKYYVYIIECFDKLLYVGITNDISRRFEEHVERLNKRCFTYKSRPLNLVFNQEFDDVIQAILFEKKVKKWSSKKKRALIEGDFDLIKVLSECRNATHYKYKP